MRRFGIVTAITAVLFVLIAGPVGAGLQWCPRDPIIALNGQEVQIWVAIPADDQDAVTGPIEVDVATPSGVTQEVLFTDEGFNGYGEVVNFHERGKLRDNEMPVQLRVTVPYDRSMVEDGDLAVRLTAILPDGSVLELQDDHGRASADFTIPAHR